MGEIISSCRIVLEEKIEEYDGSAKKKPIPKRRTGISVI
jgi:hypothetical protein